MSTIKQIDPLTLTAWIESEEVLVIDVRNRIEFQAEHIRGTVNVPLTNLEIEIEQLSAQNKQKIVIVCQAGVRSMIACQKLTQAEISITCWNLEGGINNWKLGGLPIVTASNGN